MALLDSRRAFLGAAGVSVLAGLLGGCATAPGSASDAEALLNRAKAYWSLSQANDQVSAWVYEDVSLDPRWTLQAYLQRGGATYDAVEVQRVTVIDGDRAELDVDVTFSMPILKIKRHKMAIKDRWRRIDGRWYHVLQPDSVFRQS